MTQSNIKRTNLVRALQNILIEHPKSVDETYFQHMRFAASFAGRLFIASCAALIHALIPCFFEKTAGRMINEMHLKLSRRS